MVLLLLGLAFIVLTAVGMPISFAVGVSTVFATLLLPGVDNATIVQRMLTRSTRSRCSRDLLCVCWDPDGARRHRAAPGTDGGSAGRMLPAALRRSCASLDVLRRRTDRGGRSILHRRDDDPAMVKDGYSRRFATAIRPTPLPWGDHPPSIGMIGSRMSPAMYRSRRCFSPASFPA